MSRTFKLIMILFTVLAISQLTIAQGIKITGTVTDGSTGEKLIGASVMIADLNVGAVTDLNGVYSIENAKEGTYQVTASYIGYIKKNSNVKISGNVKLNFALESSSVLLNETVVKGTRAVLRETPVAFSEVKGEEMEFKLASRDIPQQLATTPSVFSSVSGGGAGDATLYVRGFSQRNVAVMVNGVPVNDMENKWVYWSNWAGLGDVLDETQVQRGVGASPYSVNAVGGSMNMKMRGVGSEEEYIKIRSEYGSDNLLKGSIAFHTKLSSNFAATGLISRRTWDGYAVGNYHKEFTYFFSVGGVFGNHSLELSGIGSPQEHGQRPFSYAKLTIADWNKYGRNFNYAMGRLKGNWFNEAVNKFHKPQFNLNWNWQVDKKSTLSTIVYYSMGRGYGSGTLGPFAPAISPSQDPVYQNYRDYDKVWSINSSTIDNKYSSTLRRSTSTILRNSVNNHDWYGILSTFNTELTPQLKLTTGIDGRFYTGKHYQEVRDLIGGDYYIDTYDVNNPNKMSKVGDKVRYYNDFYVRQFGGFGQLEYKFGDFTTFINLSASSQGGKRKDYFLYKADDPFNTTDWQNFFGYTAKTGINYNIDQSNSVFVNVGYFSSAPMVNNIFANNTNIVSKDAANEKVFIGELGYNVATSVIAVKANAFYTKWKDKAITINYSDIDPASGDPVNKYANISGSAQVHTGLELEGVVKIMRGFEFKTAGSLVIGKFENDVTAIVTPENNPTAVKKINLYTEGLYVSEFPQQQVTFQLNYRLYLGSGLNVFINPVYKFLGTYYSSFNPDTRSNPNDRAQSWKIPDSNVLDFHLGFTYYLTDFFVKRINLNFHVFNMLNNGYIVDGQDGGTNSTNHIAQNARVFYSRDRWYNVAFAFNF
ncbi:MAG: hypothetical protein CVV24_06065 [Ignavibacteriae bacterium HGW-Ignavibacteriae-3]|nr:MAG: hypothetical protein CVV24_06065 [Ignavibacteriae bacterium HGW-Ignavibacteriae-3]